MTWRKHKHLFIDGWPAAYLIVSDPRAGRRNVYTVYQIWFTTDKQARVIGRELDLRAAKTIVFNDQEVLRHA